VTTYSLGVDLSYEVDFWGRVRKRELAAGADYLASESDYRAARIGILAETISAYLEILDLRRRMTLTGEMIELLKEREELAASRYTRGLASSLDVYRVRQDLLDTQTTLPQLRKLLAGAEGRLTALLGGFREDLEALLPETLPSPSVAAPVPAGVPADLLVQRPDVRAAGHRLEAAGYVIDVREAERLPSLALSGTIGLQKAEVSGLFDVDQWFSNLAANLLAPVFDAGRLQSNVTLAEARFNEVAAAYGRTVVTAVAEVETALAALEQEGRRPTFLAARLVEARAAAAVQA